MNPGYSVSRVPFEPLDNDLLDVHVCVGAVDSTAESNYEECVATSRDIDMYKQDWWVVRGSSLRWLIAINEGPDASRFLAGCSSPSSVGTGPLGRSRPYQGA